MLDELSAENQGLSRPERSAAPANPKPDGLPSKRLSTVTTSTLRAEIARLEALLADKATSTARAPDAGQANAAAGKDDAHRESCWPGSPMLEDQRARTLRSEVAQRRLRRTGRPRTGPSPTAIATIAQLRRDHREPERPAGPQKRGDC